MNEGVSPVCDDCRCTLMMVHGLNDAFAVAVFEFLSAAAWTWVVSSWQLVFADRHLASWFCALTGVMMCCCLLCRVVQLIFLLCVALALLFRSGLVHLFLLHFRYLSS